MTKRLRSKPRGGRRRYFLVPCSRCGGLGPLFAWTARPLSALVCIDCVEGLLAP